MLTSIFAQSDQFSSGARGLILSKYIENPDQPAIFAAPVVLSFLGFLSYILYRLLIINKRLLGYLFA